MPNLYLGSVLRRARRALERRGPPTTDALLLARFIRNGDETAFSELIARHGPGIWAVCRRGTANESDAEDVFQATFLILARRADRVRKSESVGSWLFGVAVRLSRKQRQRTDRVPDPQRVGKSAALFTPVESSATRELLAILHEELARLPESLRAPLLHCYFEGLTQDEAAAHLGWKVRTLKARVDRGRKLLRSRLSRRGVDLSAALAAFAISTDSSSAPPLSTCLGLDQAAVAFSRRASLSTSVRPSVLTLAQEGVAMTSSKTPMVLAVCTAALCLAGTALVLGQGKPPAVPVTADGPLKSPAVAKTDLAGDPLPTGAISRLGTTRLRLPDFEQRVFLLPKGDSVLLTSITGTVTYWDVASGRMTATFTDPDLFRASIALSPDGDRLALFGRTQNEKGDGPLTVRLYDLKARKSVWTVRPENAPARSSGGAIRFTPDGKRLVTVVDGDVRVFAAAEGVELRREKIEGSDLAVSPDGRIVALSSRNKLLLWDWTTADPPKKMDGGPGGDFMTAVFSPDGKSIRGVPNFGTNVPEFDVATGRLIGKMELRSGFSFSPDGKTVAIPDESSRWQDRPLSALILRDVVTGKELHRLSTGFSSPRGGKFTSGAQWSKDGLRVAVVAGQRLWVWETKSGKLVSPTRSGHDGTISDLTFAPDGRRVFTGGDDHTIRAWEPTTGNELFTLQMAGWARGVAISPDGSLVAGNGLGDDLRIWDSKSGKVVFKLPGHGKIGGQRRVRFSADGQTLLTYGDDYYLRAWNLITGKLKTEHRFHPAGISEDDSPQYFRRIIDLGPDGNTFILATGKDVQMIAVDTGKERTRFEADPQYVAALSVSADGKQLVTAGPGVPPPVNPALQDRNRPIDFVVTVWDLENCKPVSKFSVRLPFPRWWGVLAFTPDGKQVVTGSFEPMLRFFEAKSGDAIGTIDLPNRPESLTFDPSGQRLAVGFVDTTALVFDVAAAIKLAKEK